MMTSQPWIMILGTLLMRYDTSVPLEEKVCFYASPAAQNISVLTMKPLQQQSFS